MPWLVVLGNGSWSTSASRYAAGVHEVDEETADAARRSGIKSLLVRDNEPIVTIGIAGPLSVEDLKWSPRGVQLVDESDDDDDEPTPVPYDFSCNWCEWTFPSRGALVRHEEFHHSELLAAQ